ncbi:MAG: SIMPL domain-containing protein [Minisyncoccia bacterium]
MCKINPNNLWQYSLAAFLIVAALVGLIFGWSIYLRSQNLTSPNSLVVSAEGKVYAKPDLAIIEASVITQNKDFKTVQLENDRKMQRMINFLKESGIEDKDIKTIQYNLQPQYDYSWCRTSEYPIYCPPKLVDYIFTQTVQIKIRDLSRAGDIVGNLTNYGANQISNISFTVENIDEYQAQARKEAIEKAQNKALSIAKATGVKIGRIISINENSNNYFPVRTMAKEDLVAGSNAAIEAGTNEISVSISLTYELK